MTYFWLHYTSLHTSAEKKTHTPFKGAVEQSHKLKGLKDSHLLN